MGPKVVDLGTKDDTKASIEALRRALPDMVEHAAMIAAFRRKFFLSLVSEGFTEAQALHLCSQSIAL